MWTWAFSSLNVKVLKVNPATLPAGQTSLWVSCPHRKEPLPLQNRGLKLWNSARCTDTHPATHWNQRTMTGAIYINIYIFFFFKCIFFSLLSLCQKENGWRQTLWLHVYLKALSNTRRVEQHRGSSFCLHFSMLTEREENFNWISLFPVAG